MPMLVGLLLAPVGALLGSALFFAVLAGVDSSSTRATLSDVFWIVVFGGGIGMIGALPTTAIVLPVAYGLLRRRSAATLAITGAVAGFLICGGILAVFWNPAHELDPGAWLFVAGIAVDGAIAGALCGWLLACIMRWLRPDGGQTDQARQA